jgi:hypothetical protein
MPSQREVFLNRFPEIHAFVDCTGKERQFQFTVRVTDDYGYHFRSREMMTSNTDGYEFSSFSEASPIAAFSKLTSKVRKALAQRFLNPKASMPIRRAHAIAAR